MSPRSHWGSPSWPCRLVEIRGTQCMEPSKSTIWTQLNYPLLLERTDPNNEEEKQVLEGVKAPALILCAPETHVLLRTWSVTPWLSSQLHQGLFCGLKSITFYSLPPPSFPRVCVCTFMPILREGTLPLQRALSLLKEP